MQLRVQARLGKIAGIREGAHGIRTHHLEVLQAIWKNSSTQLSKNKPR